MNAPAVIFGAGNIGRSFIGQLFSRAGYATLFVDTNRSLIHALNREKAYRVIIRRADAADETLLVENVGGLCADDQAAVSNAVARAPLVATSVGKNALPFVIPAVARGLMRRQAQTPGKPLDIILAENIRDGADFFRRSLAALLPPDFPIDNMVGIVETSIGKMAPIMSAEDRARDPLAAYAEAYNRLIVDKKAFKNPLPPIPGLHAVDAIKAYVDRKLFVHNLGHAAAAYLGYRYDPSFRHIYEALDVIDIREQVRAVMEQAASALNACYPADLPRQSLREHIDDLLIRFANRALADTVYRVGRDLRRKLDRNDRICGAMLLAERFGCPYDQIAEVYTAACSFRATDEEGLLFKDDALCIAETNGLLPEAALACVSGLSSAIPAEANIMRAVRSCSRHVNDELLIHA
jgi:mannitol-1-phosphate 5-dehydrogenase